MPPAAPLSCATARRTYDLLGVGYRLVGDL